MARIRVHGDGNRVLKNVGGAGTIYWYGAGGSVLGESDLNLTLTAEYIFFNGRRLARIDNPASTSNPSQASLKYYLTDHLGSTSMITDATFSTILEDTDYYPYGREVYLDSSDSNHYKFTGKERDAETGNDYFGARYYASTVGRFLTPDWGVRPTTVPYASFGDPQSLNLYGYVRNDPVSRADLDGHWCGNGNNDRCANVQVKVEVTQQPTFQKNKNIDGERRSGERGFIKQRITVGGTPLTDTTVHEKNVYAVTKDKVPQNTTLKEGTPDTNKSGEFGDHLSMTQKTDKSKATNDQIEQDFSKHAWTLVDTQTITFTIPNGAVCSATCTRTMTNAGSDGKPSAKYKLTTDQPVVTEVPNQ